MPITESVSPVDGAKFYGSKPAAKKSELNMEQFMRLLTVQLSNQNPLEPMSDRDFFAQMAQLGQVQGMDKLNSAADIQQAQTMMGKSVTAVRPMTETSAGQSQLVSGTVVKLSIREGNYYLGVQEADGGVVDVKIDALQSIQPGTDLSSVMGLVGKTVSGTAQVTVAGQPKTQEVSGKVLGVSIVEGKPVVQVQTADFGVVPVQSTNISNVIG